MNLENVIDLTLDGKIVSELYVNSNLAWKHGGIDISELYNVISVDLNENQWVSSLTCLNPDPDKYDIYESDSNYKVPNSWATMYVNTNGIPSVDLYIRSYAYSSQDYVMAFQTDRVVAPITSEVTSNVVASTKYASTSSQLLSAYTKVHYDVILEENSIQVTFRNGNTVTTGTDRGYLLVQKQFAPTTVVSNFVEEYEYTGQPIVPDVSVYYMGTLLTQNTDYRVFFDNNTDIGTATMTIRGIKDYTGRLVYQFDIGHFVRYCTISGISSEYDYISADIIPDISVYNTSGALLAKGTDYDYTLYDNFFEGTARCEISGLGNYSGVLTKTFEIVNPHVTTLTFSGTDTYIKHATSDTDMQLEFKDGNL